MSAPLILPNDPEKATEKFLAFLEQTDPEKAKAMRESLVEHKETENLTKAAEMEWEKQKKEPHVWLTIQRPVGDTEDRCFIGAAGVNYNIEKGKRVPVPESVLRILEMAKVDGFVPVINEETGEKRMERRQFQTYTYSVHGPASPEEVADYKKKNDTTPRYAA